MKPDPRQKPRRKILPSEKEQRNRLEKALPLSATKCAVTAGKLMYNYGLYEYDAYQLLRYYGKKSCGLLAIPYDTFMSDEVQAIVKMFQRKRRKNDQRQQGE